MWIYPYFNNKEIKCMMLGVIDINQSSDFKSIKKNKKCILFNVKKKYIMLKSLIIVKIKTIC